MSIHVTVSSNPVCINRSKVLLTDVDLAKKNEWNRRRKLRLQQVRQQARDLASNLRKKCDVEKKQHLQQECDESEQELKNWHAKQLQKLQEIYDSSIAAVGTGHKTANCQVEDNENTREQQKLRDALAKARGALARERAKVYDSQKKSANVPVKSSAPKRENVHNITKKCQEVHNRIQIGKSPSKTKIKPKYSAHKIQSPQKKGDLNKSKINGKPPTECTITSPSASKQHEQRPRTVQSKVIRSIHRQRSCSPPRRTTDNVKEVTICDSDDSDDSNATWPPRKARVSKISISPHKVRFYNHDQRISNEYLKPSKSVTRIDQQCQEEMEKFIEEEEEALIKKTELDANVQKRSVSRGQMALKKERLEREFKSMAQQYSEIDKQQRIARIFEFPYPVERRERRNADNENLDDVPSTSKQPAAHISDDHRFRRTKSKTVKPLGEENIDQQLRKCFEVAALFRKKKGERKQDTDKEEVTQNPFTLKNLIQDLEKERDLLLNSSVEKSPFKEREKKNASKEVRRTLQGETIGRDEQEAREVPTVSVGTTKNDIEETSSKKEAKTENIGEPFNKITDRSKEKHPHPLEVNVIMKPVCECCNACNCQHFAQRKSSDLREFEEIRLSDQEIYMDQKNDNSNKHQQPTFVEDSRRTQKKSLDPEHISVKNVRRNSLDIPASSFQHENESSNSDAEVGSSSSDEIKITVKVTEKNRTNNKLDFDQQPPVTREQIRENEIPWYGRLNERIGLNNSSSSYYSPPAKLSPSQQSILNSILLKMCLKNNNPELHKYIKRLLCMSKANIEGLAISSSSEISIHSDIFSNLKMDHVTGTYYLSDNKTENSRKVRYVESKSGMTKDKTNLPKTKVMKKVIQMNSSSEDSGNGERIPRLKETDKSVDSPPRYNTLADEYSLRLKELIQMLNQASTRIRGSQFKGDESSSYICPSLEGSPAAEKLESNSYMEYEHSNSYVLENESIAAHTLKDNLEDKNGNVCFSGVKENSAYMRNNITSLGLPFELLPKPFTITEEQGTVSESPLKPKPPVSSNKFRMEDYLPHELSAIPEISSRICQGEQRVLSTKVLQESDIPNIDDEYLSDVDLLDISSIKSTPKKVLQQKAKEKDTDEEPLTRSSGACIFSNTSSLSILSHMSNESLIDIKTDVSEKDVHSFLESPSAYIEEVFRSLGVGWALPQLRKTRQSRQKNSSTTSTSNENSNVVERKRTKSVSKMRVSHSHSTPKKSSDSQYSSSSGVLEEMQRKFEALKNNRLSLTPPDLSLKIPVLGSLNNNLNNSDSSRSVQ